MVVAAFPLAKIGLLLLKQLSRPIANIIKNKAKSHPVIRQKFILPIGRGYQRIEHLAVWKSEPTPAVTEDEIVELGANAIGEIVVFGILTAVLLFEINRMGEKRATIQKIKDDEVALLKDLLLETQNDVLRLHTAIHKLQDEMKVTRDAMSLEEEMHHAVYDFYFLDDEQYRDKSRRFGSKKTDQFSPSPKL